MFPDRLYIELARRSSAVCDAAEDALIELTYARDLTLRVSDNGVGIDPAVARGGREGHFGLQGMRERASRIGATLSVDSSAGSGTEIKLLVPGRVVFHEQTASLFTRLKMLLGW